MRFLLFLSIVPIALAVVYAQRMLGRQATGRTRRAAQDRYMPTRKHIRIRGISREATGDLRETVRTLCGRRQWRTTTEMQMLTRITERVVIVLAFHEYRQSAVLARR
jgi:hypothetical protein